MKNKATKIFTYLLMIISSLGISFLIQSCEKEDIERSFEDSIFIQDPVYTNLPAYSESGYNTFGVMIDRQPLFSDNYTVPLKITIKNDTTTFTFSTSASNYYSYEIPQTSSLQFIFPGYVPTNYKDLSCFKNLNKDLASGTSDCIVKYNDEVLEIISGNFEVTAVKKMYLDNKNVKSIIAGKFDFQTYSNGIPVSFHDGRYDVSVGSYNFFILN